MAIKTHGFVLITGLSTDIKPTSSIIEGTYFVETDTHARYVWSWNGTVYTWVGDSSAGSALYNQVSVTHSELTSKIAGSQLVPGQLYRITDYASIYRQYGTNIVSVSPVGITAGLNASIEEIVVRSITPNSIDATAVSVTNVGDVILYNPVVEPLDTFNTKGKIYYRENIASAIITDYDFRAVKFRVYATDAVSFNSGTTYNLGQYYFKNGALLVNLGTKRPTPEECIILPTAVLTDNTNVLPNNITTSNFTINKGVVFGDYYTFNDITKFKNATIKGMGNVLRCIGANIVERVQISGTSNTFIFTRSVVDVTVKNISNSLLVDIESVELGRYKYGISSVIINNIIDCRLSVDQTSNASGMVSVPKTGYSMKDTTIGSVSTSFSNFGSMVSCSVVDADVIENYATVTKLTTSKVVLGKSYTNITSIFSDGDISYDIKSGGIFERNKFYDTAVVVISNGSEMSDCTYDKACSVALTNNTFLKKTYFISTLVGVVLSKISLDGCFINAPKLENLAEPVLPITITATTIDRTISDAGFMYLVYQKYLASGAQEQIILS